MFFSKVSEPITKVYLFIFKLCPGQKVNKEINFSKGWLISLKTNFTSKLISSKTQPLTFEIHVKSRLHI